MKQYFWNTLLILDQLVNTVFGPLLNIVFRARVNRFGDPGETLSSVFGKNIQSGECVGCKAICRVLNWFQPNHCIASIEADRGSLAD